MEKILEHQVRIIQLLSRYEKTVGDLYHIYSERFDCESVFWGDLADAEDRHSSLLEMISLKMTPQHIFHNLSEFSEENIKKHIGYLEKKIEKVQNSSVKEFSLKDALRDALETEASILEAHFYDIAVSDMKEFHLVASILKKETRLHAKQIENKMVEYFS